MADCAELSLEQQYTLRVLTKEIQGLSKEEAQANLIDLYRQMIIRENYHREIEPR